MSEVKTINLQPFRGKQSTIFTGRVEGRNARKILGLDSLDTQKNLNVSIIIPEGTTSFNPSFYLGLLYESLKNIGVEGFNKKYNLDIQVSDIDSKTVIEDNLSDGLRNALNSLSNKDALSRLFE